MNQKLSVVMTATEPEVNTLQYTFKLCLQNLRRSKGLTVQALAKKLDLDHDEIIAMERNNAYRPSPLTIHRLSEFYKLPEKKLATLAGAFRVPEGFHKYASQFAAQSESFSELTRAEKSALDGLVSFLRSDG